MIALSVRRPFTACVEWSGCSDSNRGPPAPKAGALARLRYAPIPIEDRKHIQFSPSVNLHFTNKVRHLQALPEAGVSDVSALLPETISISISAPYPIGNPKEVVAANRVSADIKKGSKYNIY